MALIEFKNNTFFLKGFLNKNNAEKVFEKAESFLQKHESDQLIFDLKNLENIDSAGVATLNQIQDNAKDISVSIKFQNISEKVQDSLKTFSSENLPTLDSSKKKAGIFENAGGKIFEMLDKIKAFVYLTADMFYWGIGGLFSKKGQRKGEFVNQANLVGVNALPIVALISFLVGFILSLQSAQQLRQFGANIFVVDLITISMTREMAPLMTAIILAGRSGSSIASELATMKISEEIDAMKTMALNPIKYVVLPKLYAMTIATPLLTVMADIVGILGGFLVGVMFLKIGAAAFVDRMASVMVLKDVITLLVKSIVFSWIITIVGIFYGLQTEGGADAVGRSTTSSVVMAIFMVIVADSVLGLLFY
ncbi:MAG: MlaE family lipid ABC transporter permease subunit [Candidatus Cloacimonadota bacterium]|nr:MlaE family lipid ABC transporter permease subunit [Candidatus Cloacimonadota bacterium]